MATYTLASTEYLDTDVDNAVCYIGHHDWASRLEEGRRLFVLLKFSEGASHMSAVEHVAPQHIPSDMENPIFVPLWMIPPDVAIGGDLEVEFFTDEAFPPATRIVLKPLDSAFYNTDAKEMLTAALTRLGVLQKEKTVMLRLEELGGYEMGFYITELEPADTVLLDADEVAVEFEEAADQWDGRRPGTPIPPPIEPMFSEDAVVAEGTVLGGGPVRRLPDGRAWNPYR
jgi:hypothetical protein